MKNKLSLQDWLYYIESLHVKFVDLGLDRVQDIAIELNLLHPAPFVILVGGTNGKGTTCCLLETIFLNCGFNVGVYSSPHLISYTERVRVNGKELTDCLHVMAMDLINDVRSAGLLTYFEFTTLSSLYLLKSQNLDIIIIEVGLGGRLDATNIVNPDMSIVTNIAIDHVDFLGSDYRGIMKEKCGIFRMGKPAIIGDFDTSKILKNDIFDWYGVVPFVKNDDWWFRIEGDKWCWWDKKYRVNLLPLPKIPIENAAVVLAAVRFFPFMVSKELISYALSIATLPGRFQIISYRPFIILDVAHNPHAVTYLKNRLNMLKISGRFRLIVGMLKSKNIFDTLHILDSLMPIWYCVSLDCVLGASSFDLVDCIGNYSDVCQFVNIFDAFKKAIVEATSEDCIVVFGSFYTVTPVLRLINEKVYFVG